MDTPASVEAALTEAAKAILLMIATMEQREQRMHETIDGEVLSLHAEVDTMRNEFVTLVGSASAQIAAEARQALDPVAADYHRAVSTASAQLYGASKTIWLWLASGGALLLLSLVVSWAVVSVYRHQLTDIQEQLQNYKNALPTLQAFYASDAAICDGRLCVNLDPNSQRFGDKHQYRQVKPRPPQ